MRGAAARTQPPIEAAGDQAATGLAVPLALLTTTPSMQLLSALHAQDELHERAWQRGERGASGRAIGQEESVRADQQQRCQLSEERAGSNFAAPVQGGWFAAEDR